VAQTAVKQRLHLLNMRGGAGNTVDTLHFKPKQVHRLNALIYYHRYWRAIPPEEIFQCDTKNRVQGRLSVVVEYTTTLLDSSLTCRAPCIVCLRIWNRGTRGEGGVALLWRMRLRDLLLLLLLLLLWLLCVCRIARLRGGLGVEHGLRMRLGLGQRECRRRLGLHLHRGTADSASGRRRRRVGLCVSQCGVFDVVQLRLGQWRLCSVSQNEVVEISLVVDLVDEVVDAGGRLDATALERLWADDLAIVDDELLVEGRCASQ
jgi:hypothetical protein